MLEEISARIRENFDAKDSIREEGLKISREVVRECRTASFALHGQDFGKADKNKKTCSKAVQDNGKNPVSFLFVIFNKVTGKDGDKRNG